MELIKNCYEQFVKAIKLLTPASRQAPDYECVGITGCEPNSILKVERNGDFHDFQVKVLGKIKPLFTDKLLLGGLELILKEEYDAVIRLFDIKQEFIEHGYEIISYVFVKWLKLCKIDLPEIAKNHFNYYCTEIESRMFLVRSDCLNVPLEIINIGANVVPSDWIGKIFSSGKELHSAIDTLDWRRGKPPVTYCCIYSMKRIQKDNTGLVKNLNNGKLMENVIITQLDCKHMGSIISWDQIITTHYVEYKTETTQLIICYTPGNHFTDNTKVKLNTSKRTNSVGVLSSTMQKCIRHGSCSVEIMEQIVKKLARAKPYNLPEQQYLKVSGARQLLWRLFISCIEDFRFYYDSRYLNLLDILLLAFVCNKEPDYVINENLLDKISILSKEILLADAITDYYEWRTYKELKPTYATSNNIYQNTIFFAQEFMPKMSGDTVMINKYFSLLSSYKPSPINPNTKLSRCAKCECGQTPKYTGIDIHCNPTMILKLQAILRKPYTTQKISSLVWEFNSKYSNRKPHEIELDLIDSPIVNKIFQLQKEFWGEYVNSFDIIDSVDSNNSISASEIKLVSCAHNNQLDKFSSRTLFLKIFGKKHRIPAEKSNERVLEVTFSYQDWKEQNQPIQIKFVNSDEYLKGTDYKSNINRVYKYLQSTKLNVPVENCITGFKWAFDEQTVRIGLDSSSNPVVYVNSKLIIKVSWFDGTSLVKPIDIPYYQLPSNIESNLINNMLGHASGYSLLDCNLKCRKSNTNINCIDIKKFISKSDIANINLLKAVYVKFLTAYDNIITISQVTRMGEKVDESVDYLNEGKYLQLLNLLNYCYPQALKISGELKYHAISDNPHYSVMIQDIQSIISANNSSQYNSTIKNKTKLWTHQEQTASFIIGNIVEGKRGFGDASNVGAGKTLSALATAVGIFQNKNFKTLSSNKILVLLPTEKLYKTWIDEITKHFDGLNWITQNPDGSVKGNYTISTLNIYITTMGRNREHPIKTDWLFVIIDECLTVQNKEALQTMEAWKQVINSQFGVLLLSATFFRTRFDKLLYMLKMLNTGLPETKEYLDTILYDSIKVNLPETKRTWVESIFKKQMSQEFYSRYNQINLMDISNELKYIKLDKFIRETVNYIEIFSEYINSLTKSNSKTKLLIYAASKREAELISKIKGVGLYPDITQTHVVVSYANGTYGLNDLVGFNHILSRPPEPDKLPQMKGRLDRPGQNLSDLAISYIIIANTIEEAHYSRLEICNRFYSNHIMPLSDFYSLAVDVKPIDKKQLIIKEIIV
jgi:superfamily II DNA or RNA helicase